MSPSIVQILEGAFGAAWRRAVALSAAGSGLPSNGIRRNLPATILLELSDGSIHRLTACGAAFTPDLVEDLAEAILRVRTGKVTLYVPVSNWLREIMSMPSAELTMATPEDLIAATWNTRAWAVALVLHEHEAAGVNEATVRSRITAIEATLGQALTGFRSGLDQEALRMSGAYPKPGNVYNYLASPTHRRVRLQLGSQFSCLLPLVATDSGDSAWTLLRTANDRGDSVIGSASHLFGVQPSTVRALRSAPADLFVDRDLPAAVIRLLDLCRPEARPKDVAGWQRLRDTLAAAEEGFGPITTFLTRAVVRETLHSRPGTRLALQPDQVPEGAVRALEDVLRAILASAEAERARLAIRSSRSSSPPFSVLSGHAADRWLAERFSTKQLLKLAGAWRMAWDEARRADAPARKFAEAQVYWSLISREYQTSNGLIIAPLTSPAALRMVGELKNLCLATTSHLERYDRACRLGQAYLVVVRQGKGQRRILSTARIELASSGDELAVRVVEHQGHSNGPPPPGCAEALAELQTHIRTSTAAKSHIQLGQSLQRARRNSRPTDFVSMVESGTRIKALQIALGEALVAEVVRHCVDATRRTAS